MFGLDWKITALLIGGVSAIIATVAKILDERSKVREGNKKLNFYFSIVGLLFAVLGLGFGVLSELSSQRKALEAAQKQAEEAAKQSTATRHLLEGMSRIFTRFNSISMKFEASISFKPGPLRSYREKLEKTILALVKQEAEVSTVKDGVRVNVTASGIPNLFDVDVNFEPQPKSRIGLEGELFIKNSVPVIAMFKSPIDAKKFIDSLDRPTPDINLMPVSSLGKLFIVRNHDDPLTSEFLDRGDLRYERIDMPSNKWSPNGKILSIKDLEGSQAIIYFPSNVPNIPGALTIKRLDLFINDMPININISDISPVETSRGMIYEYIFPDSIVDF